MPPTTKKYEKCLGTRGNTHLQTHIHLSPRLDPGQVLGEHVSGWQRGKSYYSSSGYGHTAEVWAGLSWLKFHLHYNVGDAGSIPGSERSPIGGHGSPLQYYCLEKLMNRAGQLTVHKVTQSRTQLKQVSRHACTIRSAALGNDFASFCLPFLTS